MILSTAYAPPIQYFAKLASGRVLLEACEHYIKQTYRNRCRILAADGVQELSIPVEQGASEQCPIREVRISACKTLADPKKLLWYGTFLRVLCSRY